MDGATVMGLVIRVRAPTDWRVRLRTLPHFIHPPRSANSDRGRLSNLLVQPSDPVAM